MATQNDGSGSVMEREPLLSISTIVALVSAALALIVAFGLSVSDNRQQAIISFVAVLAPLVTGWISRGRVYSPATVAELLRPSAPQPPTTPTEPPAM